MSILTPGEITKRSLVLQLGYDVKLTKQQAKDFYDTLAAYAEVVERVAEKPPIAMGACGFCFAYDGIDRYPRYHEPDCLYLVARKLRGYDD